MDTRSQFHGQALWGLAMLNLLPSRLRNGLV
jgi:hypothetical protein